jgi:hypothetical protein
MKKSNESRLTFWENKYPSFSFATHDFIKISTENGYYTQVALKYNTFAMAYCVMLLNNLMLYQTKDNKCLLISRDTYNNGEIS